MYDTWHPNCDDPKRLKGRVNFTVWSDVFTCPQCGEELIFWDVAVSHDAGEVRETWNCTQCGAGLAKNPSKDSGAQKAERTWETVFDRVLGRSIRRAKQLPILINYSINNKRLEKRPDAVDLAIIRQIEDYDLLYPFPSDFVPEGYNTKQPLESHGITHIHQFYTQRNLIVLSSIWAKVNSSSERRCQFWFTSALSWCGRENRLHLGNYFGRSGGVSADGLIGGN